MRLRIGAIPWLRDSQCKYQLVKNVAVKTWLSVGICCVGTSGNCKCPVLLSGVYRSIRKAA